MSTKEVLAENLKQLMQRSARLDTLPKVTKASDGRLSNGKLDRVRRAVVATDVDTVDELAKVFGIEAWEMLRPVGSQEAQFVSRSLQNRRAASWPMERIDLDKLSSLRPEDALRLEGALLVAAAQLGIDIAANTPGKRAAV